MLCGPWPPPTPLAFSWLCKTCVLDQFPVFCWSGHAQAAAGQPGLTVNVEGSTSKAEGMEAARGKAASSMPAGVGVRVEGVCRVVRIQHMTAGAYVQQPCAYEGQRMHSPSLRS